MSKVDITNSQVTFLVEVDGNICLVRMEEDEYKAISFVVKKAIQELIKTEVTQNELNRFLLPNWFEAE